MRKLLIFCFVTVLICCDTFTPPETKSQYSSYFLVYDGLSVAAFQGVLNVMGTSSSCAETFYNLCKRYPCEDWETPYRYSGTLSRADMERFVSSRPQMHASYRDSIYRDLEDDGVTWCYFEESYDEKLGGNPLYYLYIKGQGTN